MEAAKETVECGFLSYAKIKVKGFSSGFMDLILELSVGNERIRLGYFNLDKIAYGLQSRGMTLGLIFRLKDAEELLENTKE